MQNTVGKCFRHFESNRFVGGSVACRDNNTVIGQAMLSNHSIKSDLIRRRLNRLRCGGNFVKEQNVDDIVGIVHLEDLRLEPYGKGFVSV